MAKTYLAKKDHTHTAAEIGAAEASHTHNYAGSSSSGGAATSANKLNTNAGDSNTPVYFSNGVPVACTALDLNTTGSAAKWTTARTLTLSGDVSGSASIDGSGNVTLNTTIADDSHNHVIGNVDGLQDALDSAKIQVVTTAGTGAAYTATVDGIDSLAKGTMVVIVPHTVSTSTAATLNVNSLGAKAIRQITSYSSGAAVAPASASFLTSGYPVLLMYNGTYWVQLIGRANAADFYGTLAVAKGGTGATDAATARKNLGAVGLGSANDYIAGVHIGNSAEAIPYIYDNGDGNIGFRFINTDVSNDTVSYLTTLTIARAVSSANRFKGAIYNAEVEFINGNAEYENDLITTGSCCIVQRRADDAALVDDAALNFATHSNNGSLTIATNDKGYAGTINMNILIFQ